MEEGVGLGEIAFVRRVPSPPRTGAAIATYDHPALSMSVDFTIRDFFRPLAIAKLHQTFERSQWFTQEQFDRYQQDLLHRILEHAYATVPFYRDVFNRLRLRPADFRSVTDLQKLPTLSKQTIREHANRLRSSRANSFGARTVRTSGTSCEPISFL